MGGHQEKKKKGDPVGYGSVSQELYLGSSGQNSAGISWLSSVQGNGPTWVYSSEDLAFWFLSLVHFTLDLDKCLRSNRLTKKFWALSQDQIKLVLDPEQMQFSAFATLLSWKLKVHASGHKLAAKSGNYDILLRAGKVHSEESLLEQFSYDSLHKERDQQR